MAQNVFSGLARASFWGKNFLKIFFADLHELKYVDSKNEKKKFENFFPIVGHLGHPGLTLNFWPIKFRKKNFFSSSLNGPIRKVNWLK